MASFRAEQRFVVVASATTQAEAEFIQMTLLAHGIVAVVTPSDPAHPSLNFVGGIRVSVHSDAEDEARELLGTKTPPAAP